MHILKRSQFHFKPRDLVANCSSFCRKKKMHDLVDNCLLGADFQDGRSKKRDVLVVFGSTTFNVVEIS